MNSQPNPAADLVAALHPFLTAAASVMAEPEPPLPDSQLANGGACS